MSEPTIGKRPFEARNCNALDSLMRMEDDRCIVAVVILKKDMSTEQLVYQYRDLPDEECRTAAKAIRDGFHALEVQLNHIDSGQATKDRKAMDKLRKEMGL